MLYGQKSKMCSSAVRTVGVSSNVLCFVFYVAVRMGALNCAIRSQLSPRASAITFERKFAMYFNPHGRSQRSPSASTIALEPWLAYIIVRTSSAYFASH